MEAADAALAKSARQRVQTDRARQALWPSTAPTQDFGQSVAPPLQIERDRASTASGPAFSKTIRPGQRQTDASPQALSRPQRPPGRYGRSARWKQEHAGTRRLDGCTEGRDAQRSSATSHPADRTGLFPEPGSPGCDTGRAARTRHPFTYPVRTCRGAPQRRRRDGLDAFNKRRTPAPGRPHRFAAGHARRTAPRRYSIWPRPC